MHLCAAVGAVDTRLLHTCETGAASQSIGLALDGQRPKCTFFHITDPYFSLWPRTDFIFHL